MSWDDTVVFLLSTEARACKIHQRPSNSNLISDAFISETTLFWAKWQWDQIESSRLNQIWRSLERKWRQQSKRLSPSWPPSHFCEGSPTSWSSSLHVTLRSFSILIQLPSQTHLPWSVWLSPEPECSPWKTLEKQMGMWSQGIKTAGR